MTIHDVIGKLSMTIVARMPLDPYLGNAAETAKTVYNFIWTNMQKDPVSPKALDITIALLQNPNVNLPVSPYTEVRNLYLDLAKELP